MSLSQFFHNCKKDNGYVWMSEKSDMPLLLKAIAMIERKAHKSGLTDEIANFLRSQVGDRPRTPAGGENEAGMESGGGEDEPGAEPGYTGEQSESESGGENYGQQ